MHRWASAATVLALAFAGCGQMQPGGSPYAGFQPTRLPAPTTGAYGTAKGDLRSANAGVSANASVPPSWQSGSAATPNAGTAGTAGATGGLTVPPNLSPTTGGNSYYPGSSSTASGASVGGLASQLQGMPVNDAIAGVRPSGSFGAGGSFATPGTAYGAPLVGYGAAGGNAQASFNEPVTGPAVQPMTTFGPTMNGPSMMGGNAVGGQNAAGGALGGNTNVNSSGSSPSSGVPPSWMNGASSSSNDAALQWRTR